MWYATSCRPEMPRYPTPHPDCPKKASPPRLYNYPDLLASRRRTLPAPSETSLAFNGHSMVGTLERVLVCSPRTAGWNQPERVANWKVLGFQHEPNFAVAQSQHEALRRELEAAGAEVGEMPAAPDLSLDAVYTHDA